MIKPALTSLFGPDESPRAQMATPLSGRKISPAIHRRVLLPRATTVEFPDAILRIVADSRSELALLSIQQSHLAGVVSPIRRIVRTPRPPQFKTGRQCIRDANSAKRVNARDERFSSKIAFGCRDNESPDADPFAVERHPVDRCSPTPASPGDRTWHGMEVNSR